MGGITPRERAVSEAEWRERIESLLRSSEAELFAWCNGERSWADDHTSVEFDGNRSRTLVEIAERDLAELRFAHERVLALRTLRDGLGPVGPF